MKDTPGQGLLWSAPLASPSGDRLRVVGIDENGLGPKLGPLVVTGTALELPTPQYDRASLWESFASLTTASGRPRIGDSKEVSAFHAMEEAELLVLSLAHMSGARDLTGADAFLAWASLTPFESLCQAPSHAPCFTQDLPLPLFAQEKGFADRVKDLAAELTACFEQAGTRFLGVRSNIYCPFRYNTFFAHAPDTRKSNLNFEAFEEVIRHFTETFGETALFLCGKVMNLKYYAKYFEYLSAFVVTGREETHIRSEYHLEGLGELRFLHDGDRLELPIALASIVGKYVREIYVNRLNLFFRHVFPDLKSASGYNDKVTKALIDRALPRLADLNVDPNCFLRCK